jgi:GNAT superfamily N-acetyltransferase
VRVIIREAEEADYPQIIALFKEFALFEKLPDLMTNSVERMCKEKDYFHCFVAEDENKTIIGYVTYFFSYYTWTGKCLYMDDLYVKPEYRSNKTGTLLINKVIDFARSAECHKLRWQVSKWNAPAIEFYKKLGAKIDDVEQNCDLYF